jgi:lysyl-tRNA synthetase class 2
MDPKHNPEFTLMEAYLAYSDLEGMMDLTEKMYTKIAQDVVGKMKYNWCGNEINLEGPWKRVSMTDAIKEQTGIDFKKEMTLDEALKLCEEHDIFVEEHQKSIGHIINLFFEKYVEETLIQPTFLYGHPVEISPLTKKNKDDPRFVDRFELFIGGKEFANAYTELNDPDDQLDRFLEQLKEKDLGNEEANDIDYDFVEALQYGMPPTSGIGMGIDRMVMIMTGQESIQDVLFFPQMKPEKKIPQSTPQEWAEIGVKEEWVPVFRKAGYNLVTDIQNVKAQKLQMDVCGVNKKYKLGYENPKVDEFQAYIDAANK